MALEALYVRVESKVLAAARRRAKAEGVSLAKHVGALMDADNKAAAAKRRAK